MLNWVAIYRRLLRLYNVRTQQELGMALGMPFSFGLDGEGKNEAIPWPILEMVVMHKQLSWDWLLTGRFYRNEAEPPPAAARGKGGPGSGHHTDHDDPLPERIQPQQIDETRTERNPRIETRELMRRLLATEKAQTEQEENLPAAEPEAPAETSEAIRLRSWPTIEAAPPPEESPAGPGPPAAATGGGPNAQADGGDNKADGGKKGGTEIRPAPAKSEPGIMNGPEGKASPASTSGSARIMTELEGLKSVMESELAKVDKILRNRKYK